MKKTISVLLAVALLVVCLVLPITAADHPFTDVSENAWYADNVQFVYEKGLMAGTAADKFSPETKMNRAMLVTVLYRMDGSYAASGTTPFTDIQAKEYYYPALVWAYGNGIINGTAPDKFSPEAPITREMMVAIFYRYAQYKGLDVSKTDSLSKYTDAGKISTYAKTPFAWAVEVGIIAGNTATTLNPVGSATRAECSAILERFTQWNSGDIVSPVAPEEILPLHDPGWSYENGNWYYYDESSVLVTGRIFIDGIVHSFDADGVWLGAESSSIKELINAQPLRPQATGIPELDSKVQEIFAEIFKPNYTTYDKVKAIYDYEVKNFTYGGGLISIWDAFSLAGEKVFKQREELLIAYNAYSVLTTNVGVCDDYAAAFMVMTRAIGLESYVVSGTINGKGHAWNNMRVSGKLYFFDAQAESASAAGGSIGYYCFGKSDKDVSSSYVYYDRNGDIATQTGFQSAEELTISLTITDDSGTSTESYTFDVENAYVSFFSLESRISVYASGTVQYTLEITSGAGDLYVRDSVKNELVSQHIGEKYCGTFAESGGYQTIEIQEWNSGRNFVLDIYH